MAVRCSKTFSARANEMFRGLHPQGDSGYKENVLKRPVSQQFIRFTLSLYEDCTGAKNLIGLYYRPQCYKRTISAA